MRGSSLRRERRSIPAALVVLVGLVIITSACVTSATAGSDSRPVVIATTSIWADVASNIACDGSIVVESLVPRGADSHIFELSLRGRVRLEAAALLIANGLGLEGRVTTTVESYAADGGVVFSVLDQLTSTDLLADRTVTDPHVWLDPSLVAAVIPDMAAAMARATDASGATLDECARLYVEHLVVADETAKQSFQAIPHQRRLLVTDHDALRNFASHYDFTVIGSVTESTSSLAEPSPAALDRLAAVMVAADVRSIFVEVGSSRTDAAGLERLVDDLILIELAIESLGAPGSETGTYLDLIVTNARRIADALGN